MKTHDYAKGPLLRVEIPNTPVEFVIVAPINGRDQVVVSSNNAGLDIIGLAADIYGRRQQSWPTFLSLFGRQRRVLKSVTGLGIPDFNPSKDDRTSVMRFAWVGECSNQGLRYIEEKFRLHSHEIAQALVRKDRSQLEFALAPVILACTWAQNAQEGKRRFLYAALGIYLATVLLSFMYFIILNFKDMLL